MKSFFLIAALLVAVACGTYEVVEIFPSYSAALDDRTGRRSVDDLFPTPGTAHPGEAPLSGAPGAAAEDEEQPYQPEAMPLSLTPSADNGYRTAMNISIAARDGARLKTDLYFPNGEGKFPVIVERTPGDRKSGRYASGLGPLLARAGYVFVVQSVRGLYGSEGYFQPFKDEALDTADLSLWIAAQPWFNGTAGAMGQGYSAYTACLCAASSPNTKALILENCPSNLFLDGGYYFNGIPMIECLYAEIVWRLSEFPGFMEDLRWDDALFHLPLREMDDVLGHPLPFWDETLLHPSYDYFWDRVTVEALTDEIDAAVLHIGGWHSPHDLGATVSNFLAFSESEQRRGRAGRQAMVVGPWSAGVNAETSLGFTDFTEASRIDADALYTAWFAKWLNSEADAPGLPETAVRLFTLGSNTWTDLADWPPPGTTLKPLFLHSSGRAHDGWLEGRLTPDPPPGFEPIDSFLSDPSNPVLSEFELGTDDQRPVERRTDVLVYTSPPLEEDLTLMGSAQAVLYVSSTAPDTDLFVMMTDVDEFGFSRPVALGVLRSRFRDSYRSPSPLSPADIDEFVIDLTPVANRFLKGHSIRLNIMGSYFPFLTRNLNTGTAIGQEIEMREASVFLVHDFDYPSRLVLPALP